MSSHQLEGLDRFSIYSTEQRVYITARDGEQGGYRLLRFERHPEELHVTEDPCFYSSSQRLDILSRLKFGNPGFRVIAENCPAIIGCVRFTGCYYLLVVSKSRVVGRLCSTDVYGIESTELIPLGIDRVDPGMVKASTDQSDEAKALRLLGMVSLSRDFFFSRIWPLWSTMQHALLFDVDANCPFANDRVWNDFLTQSLRSALGCHVQRGEGCPWVTPLIHGSFRQQTAMMRQVPITITLIARRSRYHAGTRYLSRGVNGEGHVANDCDVEQIVEVASGRTSIDATLKNKDAMRIVKGQQKDSRKLHNTFSGVKLPVAVSSVTQNRGSVPLYWTQDWSQGRIASDSTGLAPLRPAPIRLRTIDPFYIATRKHFEELKTRFGEPIICVDLLRKGGKRRHEHALSAAYESAVDELNRSKAICNPEHHSSQSIKYVSFDLRHAQRVRGPKLLVELQKVQAPLLASTGIFVASTGRHVCNCMAAVAAGYSDTDLRIKEVQGGVVRTNCVDCLDRTNVAQFSFALLALGKQLASLGLVSTSSVDAGSSLAKMLMQLWEAVGHQMAEQYAGSEAHTTFFHRARGDWQPAWQSRNFLTSIRRLYSTIATDEEKQAAINLFLGYTDSQSGFGAVYAPGKQWNFLYGSQTPSPRTSLLESSGISRVEPDFVAQESEWTKKDAEGPSDDSELHHALSSASLVSSVADEGADISLEHLLQGLSNSEPSPMAYSERSLVVSPENATDFGHQKRTESSASSLKSESYICKEPSDGSEARQVSQNLWQHLQCMAEKSVQSDDSQRMKSYDAPSPALESLESIIPKLQEVDVISCRPSDQLHRSPSSISWLSPRGMFSPRHTGGAKTEFSSSMKADEKITRHGSGVDAYARSSEGTALQFFSRAANIGYPRDSWTTDVHKILTSEGNHGGLDEYREPHRMNLLLQPSFVNETSVGKGDGSFRLTSPGPGSPVLPMATDSKHMLASLDLAAGSCDSPVPSDEFQFDWKRDMLTRPASAEWSSQKQLPMSEPRTTGTSRTRFTEQRRLDSQPPIVVKSWRNTDDNSHISRLSSALSMRDVLGKQRELNFGFDDLGMPSTVAPLWRYGRNIDAITVLSDTSERWPKLSDPDVQLPRVMTPNEFDEAQRGIACFMQPKVELTVGGGFELT